MKTLEFDRIREKIIQYDHKSGLKVFVIPKKGYNKVYATFATNYGSINNTFIAPGIRSLHGCPTECPFLNQAFRAGNGSAWTNFQSLAPNHAYTAFTQTVYLFSEPRASTRTSDCF